MEAPTHAEYRRATRAAIDALRDLHMKSVAFWRNKCFEAEAEAMRSNEYLGNALVTIENLKREKRDLQQERDLLSTELNAYRSR